MHDAWIPKHKYFAATADKKYASVNDLVPDPASMATASGIAAGGLE